MGKETILIVEDDPDIVELLEYSLEREGYTVLIARNGEKGLSEAKRRKPALVLLDLMLPGLDGLQVCRAPRRSEEVWCGDCGGPPLWAGKLLTFS